MISELSSAQSSHIGLDIDGKLLTVLSVLKIQGGKVAGGLLDLHSSPEGNSPLPWSLVAGESRSNFDPNMGNITNLSANAV